ncbi:MAG: ferric reductase-like transmembrane domain-containing protein [Burkholderiales bacterium]
MNPLTANLNTSLWTRELRKTGAAAWLPAFVAVAIAIPLWLIDWPVLAQPAGLQGLLRGLGILTGVAGAALWVVSLVLMLRFPAFDRRFGGIERQYFAHHLTGTLAYLMLLAHPVLLVAAAWVATPAAAAALATPWAQPVSIVAGWLALIGLMVMMFATFFSGLPYARWKRLHATSGIAYVFAIAHVAGLLPASGEGRAGAIVLIAAMVAGFAAIAVRRMLDRGTLAARRFRVERVERLSPATIEVTFSPQAAEAPLAYAPGQFVFVAFDAGPRYAGCREYHPFTISSAPGARQFRMLIKALGDCTARMQHLAEGVIARVQGPYGGLFRDADFTRPQLWIGGGIGITPFLSMAAALPADAASVDLYCLARNAAEAPRLDALRNASATKPNLRVFALVANEDQQIVRAAVEASSAPLAKREVYLCGPPGMLQESLAWLAAAGVAPSRIHIERFDFR